MAPAQKVLVTGGVRSGKSRYAEGLLAGRVDVSYVAPGAVPDPVADPEWAARVAAHQAGRPGGWRTVETIDVGAAVADAAARDPDGAVLVDCLGTWVTGVVDALGTWDQPLTQWRDRFDAHLDALLTGWRDHPGTLVAVTNEVGWGLVSEHRSGRVFTDLLGRVNQAVAAECDDVVLLVAGRALHLR